MALFRDSERLRFIHRIMAISFRIARDQLPGSISRGWVARYIKRSESFVKNNWNRDPYECDMDDCKPVHTRDNLSQESKEVILENLGREKKSVRDYVKDIEVIRGKKKSRSSVHRFLESQGAKPFHQTAAPKLFK